jgi:hypothetical protein
LGAQGWELTEVISDNSTEYRYILKRQKPKEAASFEAASFGFIQLF